jgi:hypothetical protein
MKAKSIKGKSAEEIASSLLQSKADGFNPTLAIVFLSVKQDRVAIAEILDKNGSQFMELLPMANFTGEGISEGK